MSEPPQTFRIFYSSSLLLVLLLLLVVYATRVLDAVGVKTHVRPKLLYHGSELVPPDRLKMGP